MYSFILVPHIFILFTIFILLSIGIYQDGLSQTLSDIKNEGTSGPRMFLSIMLVLLLIQALLCRDPLREIKRLEKKADYMMECFSLLKRSQIDVFEEAKNTFSGALSQGRFSFGPECLCATGAAVNCKIRMTYPVILPYDKIARVWCDSPQTMKSKELYAIGAFVLSIPALLTGAGTAVMYVPDTPLIILDTNGNQHSLVCGPKIAGEYAARIIDNCQKGSSHISNDGISPSPY